MNVFFHYIKYSLFVAVLIISSCEREKDKFRGQVLVSSAFNFEDASVYGYNFDLAKSTRYPSIGQPLPDIIVDQFRLLDGSVKPGFSSPANSNGFALAGEFGSLGDSYDYFEKELTSFDENAAFSPSSDTVREYQVYVLKTTLNKYVKLHVRQIWTVDDVTGKHVEVMLDYYYQPDGTANFPD